MEPIKNPIARIFLHLSLWIIVLYSATPFAWATLQSLKTKKLAHSRTPVFLFKPTLDNYYELWLKKVPDNLATLAWILLAIIVFLILISVFAKQLPVSRSVINWFTIGVVILVLWGIPEVVKTDEFYDYFLNTVIIGVGAVVISTSAAGLSAYALSRYAGISGVVLILLALTLRSLPRLAFTLPYYFMARITDLYDTHAVVIIALVAVNQPFAMYMLRSFFLDIPREIEEAAMIDGASRFGAFTRVIIPIMWPGIISSALFTLVLAYHEFLLLRMLTLKNWTLAVAMQQYIGGVSESGSLPLKSAAAVSAALPLIVLIIIFQKHLVKGLTAGSVKG